MGAQSVKVKDTVPLLDEFDIRLIGVAGKAGAGKGAIGDWFQREFDAQVISFADPMREALTALFGFPRNAWEDREWKEAPLPMIGKSPRQLMQTFGTDWGRNMVNPDLWVSQVIGRWRASGCVLTVVPDVRFDNEAMAIRQAGGVMLQVDRPGVLEVASHSTEAGISPELVHQTILNDGDLERLGTKVNSALLSYAYNVS
jgi:hypothetical protein